VRNVGCRAADRVPLLLGWYRRHRRDLPWRRRHDLYGIWVSEVMLQQTRVETVVPYFRNFMRRFPSLKRLASAPLQDVLKAWEGLGYYSRARNLWRAARIVQEKYHGVIPGRHADFRGLPGVGEYIAAAVLSIGRGLAVPVADGNVLRVVCRWQGISGDIRSAATKNKVHSFLKAILPEKTPGLFNEAMMELGALACRPRDPGCRTCPWRRDCFAFLQGRTASLPVRNRKRPVPEYQAALAVILRGGKIFIQQRPQEGHLGGLWEFPGGKCRPKERAEHAVVRECREELGARVMVLAKLAEVRHAYSHFQVHLHVFICRPGAGRIRTGQPHAWVKALDLENYPFPGANHKFFPELKRYLNAQSVIRDL